MLFRLFTYQKVPFVENLDASDYLQDEDIGFKKPKKKKRGNRRVPEPGGLDVGQNGDAMQIDDIPTSSANLETNFVDDDELQAALARSRKAKMRKIPKVTPEEIASRSEPFPSSRFWYLFPA